MKGHENKSVLKKKTTNFYTCFMKMFLKTNNNKEMLSSRSYESRNSDDESILTDGIQLKNNYHFMITISPISLFLSN